MVANPKPERAFWILAAICLVFPLAPCAKDGKADTVQSAPAPKPKPPAGSEALQVRERNFRTFLPKPGEAIDEPSSQVVQVLLDRQDKGDVESYMVQVLFRGKPADRSFRVLEDRIEIDFYDTGKPSMRLSKIRGGAVEASALDEFFYRDAEPGKPHSFRVKRLVRLTLYMHAKVELKFRDTLDRLLIHFRLPKATGPKK